MTIGGVDTYYDYDEHQWKFRRLGGGPVHPAVVCPAAPKAPASQDAVKVRGTAKRKTQLPVAETADG
ncbi:MAG TPA: hypothetical protein VFH76_23775 [Kribbella sp.]|nr:hypothetical protein [Kribbella sp.]